MNGFQIGGVFRLLSSKYTVKIVDIEKDVLFVRLVPLATKIKGKERAETFSNFVADQSYLLLFIYLFDITVLQI